MSGMKNSLNKGLLQDFEHLINTLRYKHKEIIKNANY